MRSFRDTPEPSGKTHHRKANKPLVFVVQKHDASRLHYDFRLELDGVLKSWAVPRGPSMNPRDKRLAMMVEDHPFDYRTFEGIIPEGNYGAGSVIVWDRGTYHAAHNDDPAASQELLRDELERGRLHFFLDGEKLRGEFSLSKMHNAEENAWLLIKARDEYATDADVTAQDYSVKTNRTLQEVAQGRRGKKKTASQVKRAAVKKTARRPVAHPNGHSQRTPHSLMPMLATLTDRPFDKPGWLFEIKWDGYRALGEIENGKVRLYSRKDKTLNEKFAPVAEALAELETNAVLDGEIVVVDDKGMSSFALLQWYHQRNEGHLIYYVFDVLYAEGKNLMQTPLLERKQILQNLLPRSPYLKFSEHVPERGIDLFFAAREKGLEGIIAKDGASVYEPGARAHSWLKIKSSLQQEAVIGGFTKPKGGRKGLGALVLGVYQDQEFVYIGHTGGGLDTRQLLELHQQLEKIKTDKSPFAVPPKTNSPVTWVKPEMVVEVTFREWTQDNIMRQPIFLGVRDDKNPHEVCRERPESTQQVVPRGHLTLLSDGDSAPDAPARSRKPKTNRASAPRSRKRKMDGDSPPLQLLENAEEKRSTSRRVGKIEYTNLEKVYFPGEGLTKADVVEYYREIAPVILHYLVDRPESLHRFPNGIRGEDFYQKDVDDAPDWIKTVPIGSDREGSIDYVLCQDRDTLLYLVNLGCIEINPWNARVQSLDQPDYCVIDLDPQGVDFDVVVKTAQAVHQVLEQAQAESVCKTSGATGLHIFIPLGRKYTTEQSVQFAKIIAYLVHQRLPDVTSLERHPGDRGDSVYLDYLQNRRGQTLAAAYSLRPRPGATVSTPLHWSEVRKGLDPTRFTLKTIFKRLDKQGDLWKPVLGRGIDIAKCLERLDVRDQA